MVFGSPRPRRSRNGTQLKNTVDESLPPLGKLLALQARCQLAFLKKVRVRSRRRLPILPRVLRAAFGLCCCCLAQTEAGSRSSTWQSRRNAAPHGKGAGRVRRYAVEIR